jgi:hypothetical protein
MSIHHSFHQHTARSTQHAARNTQHATRNKPLSLGEARNEPAERPPRQWKERASKHYIDISL